MDFEELVEGKYKLDTKALEFGTDFVKKKYAFEIKEIPRGESDWLEVTYPFDGKKQLALVSLPCLVLPIFLTDRIQFSCIDVQLPLDLASGTFSHVLGTNTTPFERFVVDRKIMGPCWLNIKNAQISSDGVSCVVHRLSPSDTI